MHVSPITDAAGVNDGHVRRRRGGEMRVAAHRRLTGSATSAVCQRSYGMWPAGRMSSREGTMWSIRASSAASPVGCGEREVLAAAVAGHGVVVDSVKVSVLL